MGTRADFYIGRGKDAKWLCSIAYDGYPDGIDTAVLEATSQEQFLAALANFCEERDDLSRPEHGWPWPWKTSHTTDYAYAFDESKVWASNFGREWVDASDQGTVNASEGEKMPYDAFPDMKDIQNVTLGARSGLLILKAGA